MNTETGDYCNTTGHKYNPRFESVYDTDHSHRSSDPDLPAIILPIAMAALIIASFVATSYSNIWFVVGPAFCFIIIAYIFCRARFFKKYIYDICSKCGNTVKPK